MDATRFDSWTQSFSTAKASRRQSLVAMTLAAVGLRVRDGEVAAGPGCKNVGKKCTQKKDCCSGICKGKKGKKKCKGHDSWGCTAGLDACVGPYLECMIAGSEDGICYTTTGNAGYCANYAGCVSCTRDADCRPFCGPSAACVQCADCVSSGGTACAGTGNCDFPP